jgi:hypothetical protein
MHSSAQRPTAGGRESMMNIFVFGRSLLRSMSMSIYEKERTAQVHGQRGD